MGQPRPLHLGTNKALIDFGMYSGNKTNRIVKNHSGEKLLSHLKYNGLACTKGRRGRLASDLRSVRFRPSPILPLNIEQA